MFVLNRNSLKALKKNMSLSWLIKTNRHEHEPGLASQRKQLKKAEKNKSMTMSLAWPEIIKKRHPFPSLFPLALTATQALH